MNNNPECQFDGGDCCNNNYSGWDQYCTICQCKENITSTSTSMPTTTPTTSAPTIPPMNCGENFYGPSGNISSPEYPNEYPNNARCGWNISCESERTTVQITFNTFDIEQHIECLWDNVTLYEESTGSNPAAGPYCGPNIPVSYESIGDKVRLEFISDGSVTRSGFQLSYTCGEVPTTTSTTSTTPGPIECGGELKKNSGIVTSPGWPNDYPNNAYCLWTKKCPKGKTLEIGFKNFDLEYKSDCGYDSVSIYENKNLEIAAAVTFCGSDLPSTYTSDGRYAAVLFTSDYSVTKPGFKMSYSCKTPCKDKKKAKWCTKQFNRGRCNKKKIWKKCKLTCNKC